MTLWDRLLGIAFIAWIFVDVLIPAIKASPKFPMARKFWNWGKNLMPEKRTRRRR